MIHVEVKMSDGTQLALIELENLLPAGDVGEYSARFVVQTGVGPAIYQRVVARFARRRYNVLGLLRIALETLEEKDLVLDRDPDAPRPPDLARRLPPPG